MYVQENVMLAPFTTFNIGGPARWYVEVAHEEEIKAALRFAKQRHIRHVILAGGSNVLIPDEGLQALVIHITEGEFSFFENGIRAEGGTNLFELIQRSAERGLGGWEKLAGIPGSLGGAIRGNAGAFGSEIKDFIASVSAIHAETLESRVFLFQFLSFAYRNSTFKRDPNWIITGANIELAALRPERSKALIEETIAERERRHLQNVRAAGSFFMNPIAPVDVVSQFELEKNTKSRAGRVPAGWLIEQAGMKGVAAGDAIASEQHPNYIVNSGHATAHNVRDLANRIRSAVKAKFGIELVEEAALLA